MVTCLGVSSIEQSGPLWSLPPTVCPAAPAPMAQNRRQRDVFKPSSLLPSTETQGTGVLAQKDTPEPGKWTEPKSVQGLDADSLSHHLSEQASSFNREPSFIAN